MLGSSGVEGLAWSGAGTWRWQWRGGEEKLVDDIVQLGHIPMMLKNVHHEEKLLALRLSKARKERRLTREQEAALDNLAQASGASQHASSRGRPRLVERPAAMEQLMDEISQLGHVPTKEAQPALKKQSSRSV